MYKYSLSELKEEVYGYVKNFHLFKDGFFTEDDADYFISEIDGDKDFDYDTGATKCIVIPEHRDYVIKIPFNGMKCSCQDCEKCRDPWDCSEPECPIVSFYGGGGRYSDNYCERERELYNEVLENYPEFKDFFLPLELITEINHYPVYVQVKAEIYNVAEESSRSVSKESKTIVSSDSAEYCSAPTEWLAKCLEDLDNDIERYNRFIQMLKKLQMTGDLHGGNVGYYNNHAVLLDYAGFYD